MTKITVNHRRGSNVKRNGRNRYEKGHRHYKLEGRNPLKFRKCQIRGRGRRVRYSPPSIMEVWPTCKEEE